MMIVLLLAILVLPWVVVTIAGRLAPRLRIDPAVGGRIGLTVLFLFTGIGHFTLTEPMARMLPEWVPARIPIVHATGVMEIAAAVALLVPRLTRPVGILLIVFLLAALPVNIHAAMQRVDMGGHAAGPIYLLARVPLQILFIAWTWFFAARRARPSTSRP